MGPRSVSTRRQLVIVVAAAFFVWSGPRSGLGVGSVAAAQETAQPSAAAAEHISPDGGWPRHYTTASGASLIVYQPQIASWDKHAIMYSAVSYARAGAQAPALGTIKIECETSVSLEERLVNFSDLA